MTTIEEDRKKLVNRKVLSEIEQHFFKAGYAYAMLHFDNAVKELKIDKGLEKKILDEHMNLLNKNEKT